MFHVDAARTLVVDINLTELPVDAMSFSAHKTYGPKGIGALYVRRKPRIRLQAQMHGGGHERGMRSGTLATRKLLAWVRLSELPKKKCMRKINELKHFMTDFFKVLQK